MRRTKLKTRRTCLDFGPGKPRDLRYFNAILFADSGHAGARAHFKVGAGRQLFHVPTQGAIFGNGTRTVTVLPLASLTARLSGAGAKVFASVEAMNPPGEAVLGT